ncbi:hypothetical protein ACSSS7_006872 [Eimeria intestinalis]
MKVERLIHEGFESLFPHVAAKDIACMSTIKGAEGHASGGAPSAAVPQGGGPPGGGPPGGGGGASPQGGGPPANAVLTPEDLSFAYNAGLRNNNELTQQLLLDQVCRP